MAGKILRDCPHDGGGRIGGFIYILNLRGRGIQRHNGFQGPLPPGSSSMSAAIIAIQRIHPIMDTV